MFAIPGQTIEVWRETLSEAVAMQSEHISSYEVIYEEDTPLFHQLKAGRVEVNEDLACAMYEELVDRATRAGLAQYEVANFACNRGAAPGGEAANRGWSIPLPSHACLHNVNYWRGGSFHGAGPSATGYVRGARAKNWSNTTLYCDQLEKGHRAVESTETLSSLGRAGEIAAFGLRMPAGWPFADFLKITGHDLRGDWAENMRELAANGWGQLEADGFRLTRDGLRFADAAAQFFLR
jgi:oxygen-independent coproporphyrinogen-3 oxidase